MRENRTYAVSVAVCETDVDSTDVICAATSTGAAMIHPSTNMEITFKGCLLDTMLAVEKEDVLAEDFVCEDH